MSIFDEKNARIEAGKTVVPCTVHQHDTAGCTHLWLRSEGVFCWNCHASLV